jgi:hypothetical protein
VTGDSLEFDLYLVAATVLGTESIPYQMTISPSGIPLVVEMQGPDQLRWGSAGTWQAVFPGGQPPTTRYVWKRRCAEPECSWETIGDGASVTINPANSFDLDLAVESGARTSTAQKHILVQGVPNQSAAVPGPRSSPDRPALGMDKTMVRQGAGLTFSLAGPSGAQASLRLVDVAGREVAPLFEGRLAEGGESIRWRAANLPSGIYLARARIAGQTFVRRMIVMR